MDSIDRLARKIADLHKGNRNPPSTAPRIGEVTSISPLLVKWGEQIVLTADKLVLPRLYTTGYLIPNRYQVSGGGMVEETLPFKIELAAGDQVLLVPDQHFQKWYLIDVL